MSLKRRNARLLLFFFLVWSNVYAQDFTVLATKTNTPVLIDGRINEPMWTKCKAVDQFQMTYPSDSIPAQSRTSVKILFDNQFLYIGATCYDELDGAFVVQSLKRDFDFEYNDAFAVFIDAFKDATSGLGFAVNPYGVQWDGLISRGGNKGVTTTWDGLWHAEVWQHPLEKYWSVEMAIPLKTLRFREDIRTWSINFARNDLKRNEVSSWVPIARGYHIATLAQMGTLIWEHPPQKPGSNISINPYLAGNVVKDYEELKSTKLGSSSGLDAKIALSSSMNLDITVNPDFSQVEVDRQVIDLQRFELFFPEKRTFFLENSDLFSGLGNSRVSPFFSRRIGSAGNDPVKIFFGARMSGKINRDWRLGLMSLQTETGNESVGDNQNYTVAAIQRRVLKGSSLTAFLTNRQAFKHLEIQDNYNRILGFEFDYRSEDSRWSGKAFAHYALTNGTTSNSKALSIKSRYKTRKLNLFLGVDAVDENYITDMGFVPRLYHNNQQADTTYRIPYVQARSNGYYRVFPKNNNIIDFYGPEYCLDIYTDDHFKYQEHFAKLSMVVQFINTSRVTLSFTDYSPILFFPFSLGGLDRSFMAGNYPNKGIAFEYDTGKRKNIFGKIETGYKGEYMGNRFSFIGEINYRLHHTLTTGLTFSQQNLDGFPDGYGSADFSLIGSKIECSFSRSLFFTTFLQYNTQTDNLNINSRFNWRFNPMSDLYIVYTENYTTSSLKAKNRALVIKLNYWINL